MKTGIEHAYLSKTPQYFDGARADMVEKLPTNPKARILEIGCGFGGTGELALKLGKCGEYYGVELSEDASRTAREKLTDVIAGNVEAIDLPWPEQHFDALIMSEVLEHLIEPWDVLGRLFPLLRDGAIVLASSPNIAHYSMVMGLLRGDWDLTDTGVMDRTHLRWFTPRTYAEMFEMAGFVVDEVAPVVPFRPKAKLLNSLTAGRYRHLFMRQIFVTGRKPR
jgi:2-polyprenyl-3-methyl-5-hydroxy-6-metoxy-1,4-benzoquinol methylase